MALKDDEAHVSAIAELAYGCAFHYLAYGCERKFGIHIDTHAGLPRLLRERSDDAIADVFGGLGTIRQGRWYGGKGNGETISLVLEILDTIVRWSKRR
ncbi:MAG: hypothetical protein WCE81_10575 [Halobacteriota archaeon]